MTVDEGSVICEKCHKLLINKCEVKCIICGNMKQKKYSYVFDRRKYKKILKENEKTGGYIKDKEMKQYICKACHSNIQEQLQCVCCQLDYDTHLCKQYNPSNYDFRTFIVSRCLKCVVNEDISYICLSYDKALHNTSNENPIVPYHVKDKCLISAANFMKLLKDKPEYVCTCCHCLLFKNTVKVFHVEKYDFTNSIVKKCPSYRYRMRIFNNDDTTQTSQYCYVSIFPRFVL